MLDVGTGSKPAGLGPDALPAFIDAAYAAHWPTAALEEVIAQALKLQQVADATPLTPVQRLAVWPRRLVAVRQLAQALQRLPQPHSVMRHLQALLRHIGTQPQTYPARDLLLLLQALSSPAVVATPENQALLGRVRAALVLALQPALPAADDHGLRDIAWVCRCADCAPALHWAESMSNRPLQLAMAESRRNHVQASLQDAAAPLSFATVKQGSPHKLVLSKRPGLHAEWQGQRALWAADLAALDQAVSRFNDEPGACN